MSSAPASRRPLVLGSAEPSQLGGLRWLSPALLGLTAPLVIAAIAFPMLGSDGRMVIETLLMLLLVVSIVAYAISVLLPGTLTGIVVDDAQRTLTLVREGPFAVTTRSLPLAEVRDMRVTSRYDDDGYGTPVTEIVTRTGEVIELSLALTPSEIAAGRAALAATAARL